MISFYYLCISKIYTYLSEKAIAPTPVLLPGKSHGQRNLVGCSPWGCEKSTQLSNFTFTFHFHALEKEMATYSSVLAWRIPGTGEPGGLPSLGSHRVGHNWIDLAAAYISVVVFLFSFLLLLTYSFFFLYGINFGWTEPILGFHCLYWFFICYV